ncbi:MAG: MFS transporter [Candidatus Bathyarchaeota archaeon]|nr:MAG: MFS transporter [Candidatus Bathyarchaeota archaeon]
MELKSFVPDRVSTHAKIFLSAAALNGLGNGMINVVFQLYLISLGFDSTAIGAMVMMNPLGAAILTVPAGILADRYGKKKMMVFGFILICVSLFMILFARTYELFAICFFMIGLSNATFVVLTPLYSSFFDKDDMDRAFGLWGFLNILTMSLGNLVGWVPPMLVKDLGVSVQHSYWVVIAVAGVVVLVQTPLYLLSLRGAVEPESNNGFRLMIKSKGIIAKFFLLSVVSMVSGNVFFNLFTYYTNSKFGVESDALGTLFFASNFVSAGANALAPWISRKLGTLKAITVMIGLATPFYLLMPFAPSFAWISVLYIARLGLRTTANPLIGSLYMKLLREEEKSSANSVRNMANQVGGVVAPWLGGQLMETSLDLPAFVGGGLSAVLACLYFTLLKKDEETLIEEVIVDGT